MSGRRREGLAPTLFPFLAVLVCTLGTLILLLALVAQNAGEAIAATESAEAEVMVPTAEQLEEAQRLAEAADDIDRQLREAHWHRQQTVKMRDEQTAELESRRDRLAHLEDHVRRLRDDLQSLNTEVEQSLNQSGDLKVAQATLDKLMLQIDSEKNAIGNLQQELQSQTPRIVIVPHKGPNGTDRRPIYIECVADGVYLQPGNVRISLSELEPRPGMPSPLESALRVIRMHAMKDYGDAVAPYPLLVVRPDGIKSYGVARAAMTDWDDQFGYELVPKEVDLAFPETDPILSEKVTLAVRQAVQQRELLAMRFGGSGGNGSGHGGNGNGVARGGLADDGSARWPSGGPGGTSPGAYSTGGDHSGNAGSGDRAPLASAPASSLPVLSAAKMSRGDVNGAIGDGSLRSFSSMPSSPNASLSAAAGNLALQGEEAGGNNSAELENGRATAGDSTQDQSLARAGESQMPSATSSQATSLNGSPSAGGTGGPQSAGNQAPSQGQPGQASGDSQTPPPNASAMPSASLTASNQLKPPVKRVGKDWALPPHISSSRGTEMLRMIRVECHADRFVLIGEGGRGTPTVIPFTDGNVSEASLILATAVRDRVDGWGAAMQGARWQPVLDVAVIPGAETRFRQLTNLLEGSGLAIQARGTQ